MIVDFGSGEPVIRIVPVPKFRDIRTIRGDISIVEIEIRSLLKLDHPVWIEVICSGTLSASTVQAHLRKLTEGTNVDIIRTKSLEAEDFLFTPNEECESLEDLSEIDVFQRCMNVEGIPSGEHQALMDAFKEILHDMNEEDTQAK